TSLKPPKHAGPSGPLDKKTGAAAEARASSSAVGRSTSVVAHSDPMIQRDLPPGFSTPDIGGFFLRRRDDGTIETLLSLPSGPGVGVTGVGARCRRTPQGPRCQFVVGSDPGDLGNDTYSLEDITRILQ